MQYVGFMADGKIRMGSYNTQNEAYKIYMHSDEMANHPVGSIWITETETADPNQIFGEHGKDTPKENTDRRR